MSTQKGSSILVRNRNPKKIVPVHDPKIIWSKFRQLGCWYQKMKKHMWTLQCWKQRFWKSLFGNWGERDKTVDVTGLLASSSYSLRNRLMLGYTSATAILIRWRQRRARWKEAEPTKWERTKTAYKSSYRWAGDSFFYVFFLIWSFLCPSSVFHVSGGFHGYQFACFLSVLSAFLECTYEFHTIIIM